ncbi:MAG: T9SS type A sorting domain-containing protein [Bacteroidota bacterium]
MKHVLPFLSLWLLPFLTFGQPYSGTIFIDPDIITPSDSSALVSTTYAGTGTVSMYDRRTAAWETVNAYLFDVVWADSLTSVAQINPEFGSVAAATVEAEKYAWLVGQLPGCLRRDVDEIWVHKGVELFGGGNRSILIHTGQTTLYENDGILEEVLVHEAAHTSLDADHAASAGWLAAQNQDPNFISTYARDNPNREDIAESFLPWLMVRHRASAISTQNFNLITQTIPNRLAYFDSIACDLYPMVLTTSLEKSLVNELGMKVFPNPSEGEVYVQFERAPRELNIIWMDSQGRQIMEEKIRGKKEIKLAPNLPAGIYFLEVNAAEGRSSQKIVIQ